MDLSWTLKAARHSWPKSVLKLVRKTKITSITMFLYVWACGSSRTINQRREISCDKFSCSHYWVSLCLLPLSPLLALKHNAEASLTNCSRSLLEKSCGLGDQAVARKIHPVCIRSEKAGQQHRHCLPAKDCHQDGQPRQHTTHGLQVRKSFSS